MLVIETAICSDGKQSREAAVGDFPAGWKSKLLSYSPRQQIGQLARLGRFPLHLPHLVDSRRDVLRQVGIRCARFAPPWPVLVPKASLV